jgi:hypothetical protein
VSADVHDQDLEDQSKSGHTPNKRVPGKENVNCIVFHAKERKSRWLSDSVAAKL